MAVHFHNINETPNAKLNKVVLTVLMYIYIYIYILYGVVVSLLGLFKEDQKDNRNPFCGLNKSYLTA